MVTTAVSHTRIPSRFKLFHTTIRIYIIFSQVSEVTVSATLLPEKEHQNFHNHYFILFHSVWVFVDPKMTIKVVSAFLVVQLCVSDS